MTVAREARLSVQSSESLLFIVIHFFAAGDFGAGRLTDGNTGGGFNAWKQRVDRRRRRADDAIFGRRRIVISLLLTMTRVSRASR
jgi:hypothetical protein